MFLITEKTITNINNMEFIMRLETGNELIIYHNGEATATIRCKDVRFVMELIIASIMSKALTLDIRMYEV